MTESGPVHRYVFVRFLPLSRIQSGGRSSFLSLPAPPGVIKVTLDSEEMWLRMLIRAAVVSSLTGSRLHGSKIRDDTRGHSSFLVSWSERDHHRGPPGRVSWILWSDVHMFDRHFCAIACEIWMDDSFSWKICAESCCVTWEETLSTVVAFALQWNRSSCVLTHL